MTTNTEENKFNRLFDLIKGVIDELMEVKDELIEVNAKVSTIDSKMSTIDSKIESVMLTAADATAKLHTVGIYQFHENKLYLIGHGLLIKLDGKHYILSAAHVVVSLKFEDEEKIEIKWDGNGGKKATALVTDCFLDKNYVEKGTHDIGLAMVSIVDAKDEAYVDHREGKLRTYPLPISEDGQVGRAVIGHGLIYLRGFCVHLDSASHRVMIQSMSAPGCSGCPLFDNEGKLVAIVNGNSKHRHSPAVRNLSNHVFADILGLCDCQFQRVVRGVNNENLIGLRVAEELPPQEAENSKTKYEANDAERTNPGSFITKLVKSLDANTNDEYSVDDLMKILAGRVLPESVTGMDAEGVLVVKLEKGTLSCISPIVEGREKATDETATITPTK
jgi:hypothetical protein